MPTVASQIVEVDEDKQQYFVLNDDFSSRKGLILLHIRLIR